MVKFRAIEIDILRANGTAYHNFNEQRYLNSKLASSRIISEVGDEFAIRVDLSKLTYMFDPLDANVRKHMREIGLYTTHKHVHFVFKMTVVINGEVTAIQYTSFDPSHHCYSLASGSSRVIRSGIKVSYGNLKRVSWSFAKSYRVDEHFKNIGAYGKDYKELARLADAFRSSTTVESSKIGAIEVRIQRVKLYARIVGEYRGPHSVG